MLTSARRSAIHQIVERDGAAELGQLAEIFRVSASTVRRDVSVLDAAGLVLRVHGGAVKRPSAQQPGRSGILAPGALRQAVRGCVADEAARMVARGAVVALSAGPISELLARRLAGLAGLTVVTYSLAVAQAFRVGGHQDQTLILIGGILDDAQSTTGPLAAANLRSLRIDVGLVEVDATTPESGLANLEASTAELNRMIMSVADQVLFYADHTAWQRGAGHRVVTVGPAVTLVVDGLLPAPARRELADTGARIVVVGSGRARP